MCAKVRTELTARVGETVDDRLQYAYAQFTQLCKSHKIRVFGCNLWSIMGFIVKSVSGHTFMNIPRKPGAVLQVAPRLHVDTMCAMFGTKYVNHWWGWMDCQVTLEEPQLLSINRPEILQRFRSYLSFVFVYVFACMCVFVCGCVNCDTAGCVIHIFSSFSFHVEESVILARWLMGITLAIADKHPHDLHAQCFG